MCNKERERERERERDFHIMQQTGHTILASIAIKKRQKIGESIKRFHKESEEYHRTHSGNISP